MVGSSGLARPDSGIPYPDTRAAFNRPQPFEGAVVLLVSFFGARADVPAGKSCLGERI